MAEHRPAVVFIDYPNNPSESILDEVLHRFIAAAPDWL